MGKAPGQERRLRRRRHAWHRLDLGAEGATVGDDRLAIVAVPAVELDAPAALQQGVPIHVDGRAPGELVLVL